MDKKLFWQKEQARKFDLNNSCWNFNIWTSVILFLADIVWTKISELMPDNIFVPQLWIKTNQHHDWIRI